MNNNNNVIEPSVSQLWFKFLRTDGFKVYNLLASDEIVDLRAYIRKKFLNYTRLTRDLDKMQASLTLITCNNNI